MGWGEDYLLERQSNLQFHVSYKNAKYTDVPPTTVALRVIKEISEKYPPPYHLMCSGGVDSQTMLWFWKNSGVPFTAVSITYYNSIDGAVFNNHDQEQLVEFADRFQIPIQYKNFDIINFLENKLVDYAVKYKCTSPQICTHMAMSEDLEGTVIFSGNFKMTSYYDYTIFGLKRYAEISGRNIIPYFLLYDSELAVSIEKYRDLATQKDPYKNSSYNNFDQAKSIIYDNKINLLHYAGIPVIPQTMKLSGFEKIKDFYDIKSKELKMLSFKDRIKYGNFPSKRAFDLLFRYKLTDLIKYNDVVNFEG